jgi:hypothetical protein
MERSLHIPSKVGKGGDKRKNQQTPLSIIKADYVNGFKVLILFSDKKQKIIDFYPLLSKTLKGYYTKYLLPANFKNFSVSNGNISWGDSEEVIFPVSILYKSKNGVTQKEEVLYII